MRSRLIFFLSCASVLGLMILLPYRTTLVRLGLIALWAFVAISLLSLLWRKKVWRTLLLLMLALFSAFVLLPGRKSTDPSRLRQRFVQRLETYDGVRYVYGGENHRGIDCSGLVRAAMVRALFDEGISSADSALLRAAFTLWWRDTNALQLGKGGRGLTLPIGDGSDIGGVHLVDLNTSPLAGQEVLLVAWCWLR